MTTKHTHPLSFTGLTPMLVPVPPMLEQAIGYQGSARFVSFRWTPRGDEAEYDDGQRAGTGEWQGYLAFVQHPAVYPLLSAYDFGSSDSEAEHSLILDRQERRLYAATINDTETFLAQQWPKTEPIRMTREEWDAFVTEALKHVKRQQQNINMEAIHQRMEQQRELIADLQHWLNQFLPN